MFKFIKKFLSGSETESYIYCPCCGKGVSSYSQKPLFSIADNHNLNIFKCKRCKELFFVETKTYYEPSLYIYYKSSKINKNRVEYKDCIGQYFFDFFNPA